MGKDYPNEFFCSLEILRESGIENRYIGISESENFFDIITSLSDKPEAKNFILF